MLVFTSLPMFNRCTTAILYPCTYVKTQEEHDYSNIDCKKNCESDNSNMIKIQ